jgi:hypothetical protein
MHDCTIYNPDATGNSGTGIVLDDRDAGGSFVPGSYTHNIYRINMARGNFLATGIKTAGTSGGINASQDSLTATLFLTIASNGTLAAAI